MAGDEFIKVKLGADAKAWLEDCANREGLEPATFLRRMVYVAMNGGQALVTARPTIVSGESVAQAHDQADEADGSMLPTVDIDAIVAERVANAEQQGLTTLEMPPTSEPEAGVRPLHRRPVPYSIATQPAWIDGR